MKIRKILPLLLLAICSVFLLSSCDALLDAIFANNTVNVYVSSYIPSHGYYPVYDTMNVVVSGPTLVTTTAGYTGSDGLYMYWSVSVPKLSDGNYTVQVTYDHPFGIGPVSQTVAYAISFPASSGNVHNVNLDFNF